MTTLLRGDNTCVSLRDGFPLFLGLELRHSILKIAATRPDVLIPTSLTL